MSGVRRGEVGVIPNGIAEAPGRPTGTSANSAAHDQDFVHLKTGSDSSGSLTRSSPTMSAYPSGFRTNPAELIATNIAAHEERRTLVPAVTHTQVALIGWGNRGIGHVFGTKQ